LMTGDDVSGGDHPEAQSVFDLDSLQLLRVARIMRDSGTYLSGRKLAVAPRFFIGAVENPFAPPYDFRPHRVAKKVEAGAEFIQTQIVFNLLRFREFMSRVNDLGLLELVFILPSVSIVRSARGARFMKEKVPGLDVPDEVVSRMERTPANRQADEGLRIAQEVVAQLREVPGVSGVHLIAIKWEEGIVRLVESLRLTREHRRKAEAHDPGARSPIA
ncbi:MAG: methylenetetrahydrofolate reductase, partial [Candidatus Eiseniibacteriota bacterium]